MERKEKNNATVILDSADDDSLVVETSSFNNYRGFIFPHAIFDLYLLYSEN